MKLEFSWQIFEKSSIIKFHGNPSSGSRVVPWGLTDMTKLIVAFHNFANEPKNKCLTSTAGWLYHKKCTVAHITRTYLSPLNHSNTSGPTQDFYARLARTTKGQLSTRDSQKQYLWRRGRVGNRCLQVLAHVQFPNTVPGLRPKRSAQINLAAR